MTPENKEGFRLFASSNYPNEVCALLVIQKGIETLFRCENIAKEKKSNFIISPESYAQADSLGEIVGIVHSHTTGRAKPSEADLVSCEAHGLPWVIYSTQYDSWYEFNPTGYRAGLVGRPFSYGVLDCFSLVRDYYKEKLSIEVMDFPRVDEDAFKKGQSLYEENLEQAGFKKVSELQKHDVILMQLGHKVPCHAAIYLGDDLILHHLRGRLSSRDVYGGLYKKTTRFFCRYFGVNK